MDLGIKGQLAIVCGASSGMGRAIAKHLVQEEANVILIARRPEALKDAEQELKSLGKGSLSMRSFDLSQYDQIPSLVNEIESKWGNIQILINNTGGPLPGSLMEVSEDQWSETFNNNLRSVIAFTKAVVPIMKRQSYGRIVNIASQLVKEPSPTMILSNTIRAGVVAFAKSISHEIAPFGITINTLCPGPIITNRMKDLVRRKAEAESKTIDAVMEEITRSVPMKRMGTPEEFAALAVFLASHPASYITGTTIAVDGGITKSLL